MEATSSHRACAHCRSQKVRCLPDDNHPDTCQRCVRAGRPCVFTPLQKRKQRKRTDTRVAELEREMRMMRAMLKEKNAASTPGTPADGSLGAERQGQRDANQPEGLWDNGFDEDAEIRAQIGSGAAAQGEEITVQEQGAVGSPRSIPSAWNARFRQVRLERRADVVERNVLSMETARQLVEQYKTALYPHYSMVYILPSCTADQLRYEKPTLFLAIVAAAAGTDYPDLSATLDKEVLQEYANRSVVRSEKSVELVQALLISAVWYHPPNKFGELKYYEYIHMASTMASEIGIGTRPSRERCDRFPSQRADRAAYIHPPEDFPNPDLSMSSRERADGQDLASLECRRTFLACYGICAGVSISLRRPAMMRVTSYTRECLDYLDASPDAAPGDSMFVAWVRLIVIAEDISNSLSYDDPGGMASILDRTTQLLIQAFDKRLNEWHRNISEQHFPTTLKIMFYTIKLFLHELALHVDHSPEDFKAPYQMGFIHHSDGQDMPVKPLVESVAELVQNSHATLDAFLAMDPASVRSLPVFSFVRVSYPAFILAKLCLSASTRSSNLWQVIDMSSLRAESYMDKTILFVRNIVGPNGCRVPIIFLAMLFKLRQWCSHPELIQRAEVEGSDIWPEGPEKAREVLAIEGPRATEQGGSSEDTSSGTASGSISTPPVQPGFSTHPKSPQAINIPNTPEVDMATDYPNAMPNDEIMASTFAPPGTGNQIASEVVQAAWQQMDLDSSMFSLWANMDLWPGGNLTGFDDWSGFTADGEHVDWQQGSADYGGAPVP